MGTETKYNCCTENTSAGGIPKIIKGSTGSNYSQQQQHPHQQNHCNGKTNTKNASNLIAPKRYSSNFNNTSNLTNITTKTASITTTTSLDSTVATTNTVPFVPIFIDENNVIDGAKEILKVIRSTWDLNDVEFKKFTDGITNKLVGCFHKPSETKKSSLLVNGNCPNGSILSGIEISTSLHDDTNDSGNLTDTTEEEEFESESDNSESYETTPQSTDNVVLVRVYGNKTDLLIDRKAETQNIILLHSYGMAPSLYATFKNGLAYDYVPGVTLNAELILKPEVWHLVAKRMAEMHRRVKKPNHKAGVDTTPVPMLWKKINSFFDLVPEQFADPEKHKRLEKTFLPISRMRKEFAELYKQLESLKSPVVFSHNDLLLGNVVYTESQQSVNFIDYEYADYNFQAFDIGNHFAEFAGVDEVDYNRYPSREFQLEWLKVYLQTYLKRTHITDNELETLYVQVNQFALSAHYFWVIWSLIQAEHSRIDFDYVDYAYVRYNEYLARKDKFLALQVPRS